MVFPHYIPRSKVIRMKTSLFRATLFVASAALLMFALNACGGGDDGTPGVLGSGAKCSILPGEGCPAGEYCNFPDFLCGETPLALPGRCEQINVTVACTGVDALTGLPQPPVCSCAGITFDEQCWANSAGQAVRAVGACQ